MPDYQVVCFKMCAYEVILWRTFKHWTLCQSTPCFQTLLDGERATAYLTNDIRDELVQGAALEITGRYYELAADLVSVVSTKITIIILLGSKPSCLDFFCLIMLVLKAYNVMTRLEERSPHFREYVRVHKGELEQVQMSQTIMCRILIRFVCNYFLIFRSLSLSQHVCFYYHWSFWICLFCGLGSNY